MRLLVVAMMMLAIRAAASHRNGNVYDDFHYPVEEAAEMAAVVVPTVSSISGARAQVSLNGKDEVAQEGELLYGLWHVLTVLPERVVMEQEFTRWGLIVFCGVKVAPITLRKSAGRLSGIRQPFFNFTGSDPDYFKKVDTTLDDYPSRLAMNRSAHGEVDYESAASTLAPQRDTVGISNAEDVVKFVVTHAGRVKCGKRENTAEQTEGGITELQDQHAPMPNKQLILFNPPAHLSFWPRRFENSKTGLVGGFLNIANVAAFSASNMKGFDEVVFSPSTGGRTASSSASSASSSGGGALVPCQYTNALKDQYVADYTSAGPHSYASLASAKEACDAVIDCNAITQKGIYYSLRASSYTLPSPYHETSWLVTTASKPACHPQPVIPGINYNPGVYVRLREQTGASWLPNTPLKYFYVTNGTAGSPAAVSSAQFYTDLLAHVLRARGVFTGAMEVHLPGNEGARQSDMARAALLSTLNNYIGNQSNYGFGATYWSYGREDNGSLPLNVLSVDTALLEWGVCDPALHHLAFYYENYVIRPEGTINYYTWGNAGDSVGDTGRLISQYLRAVDLCTDGPRGAWATRYLPTIQDFARLLLRLRAASKTKPAPPGCKGLLPGPPEHDWSGTKDLYFYNNNVWVLRGMEELGTYLTTNALNTTLGAQLLSDAVEYRAAILASVDTCTVQDSAGQAFLPPYAKLNATPYTRMTESREASYSNFRFFPEGLLADVLPRNVERALVHYHNDAGGRLGGTSRWSTHLDDMPTAGWGYGALTANRTNDFTALLYGHMANYQSRGSFHSTEQLSFLGEGLYRAFLHWDDPLPNTTVEAPDGWQHGAEAAELREGVEGYYGNENDVSFCIVSEVLVARLTRWQVVMEDYYRPMSTGEDRAVWLARAAPRRWFLQGGFRVAGARVRGGRVDYTVSMDGSDTASFSVTITENSPGTLDAVLWKARLPGALLPSTPPLLEGCTLAAVGGEDAGAIAVRATAPIFKITAKFM